MSDWNAKTIAEFRANDGRVGGTFEGAPLVLVHHRGRKTGREYVNPVMYLPDDADNEAIYVFATKGGAPSNPDWYRNLTAAGQGTVERGTETYPVTVRELQGDERDRIYDEQARRYPGFADYAKRTAGIRTIPVLELNRASRRSLNTPDEESEMTYDNEAIVRHAYHTAEGSVLDVAGFVASFANDGVINLGHAGIEPSGVGQESYRGEQLGQLVLNIAKLFPDVHRELHRVNVLGQHGRRRGVDSGHLPRAAGDPFRHRPADRSEGRCADRRLLVPTRQEDREIRLLRHGEHHVGPSRRELTHVAPGRAPARTVRTQAKLDAAPVSDSHLNLVILRSSLSWRRRIS
jgi:deazaflavin-dependent oxidoreductase (nitroreductase family)